MVLGAPGCSTERSTPEWTLDDLRTFGLESVAERAVIEGGHHVVVRDARLIIE
jgi:hypothetical protein